MDKIKMAIIGAGVWGENHAAIYHEHPLVELTAICDLNITRAASVAKKYNIPADRVFSDHKEMIKKADFDAVAIVTPDFLHADVAIDCANAKKHMLIEKPLATTRKDVEAILNAVEKNNVRIMVDFHNRWSPPFVVMKQAMDEGDIGDPYSAYFRLNDKKWVATNMLSWASKSSILWFLGSHSVDTLRWVFNDEVKKVYSVSREGILKKEGVDTVDIYQTILEFRNGGIATMENGWITPDSHPCINDIKFNIIGTKGMFNLDLSNNQLIERYTESKNDHPDLLVHHSIYGKATGFAYQSIQHFVDKLISGEEFFVSIKDAMNTTYVLLAIMESAKTGKPVEVQY